MWLRVSSEPKQSCIRARNRTISGIWKIARNEAHVRLSSSMWYVCLLLRSASAVGIVTYVLAIVLSRAFAVLPTISFSPIFLPPAVVLLVTSVAKWAIERTLHYQREREVLFILETAHWLCVTGRAPKIFQGLEPQTPTTPPQPRANETIQRRRRAVWLLKVLCVNNAFWLCGVVGPCCPLPR